MMTDITLAIANQLERIFPDVTIYRENVKQGFKEPCFFVHEISSTSAKELGSHQMRKNLYAVMYFPDSKNDDAGVREQAEIVREKLLDQFDFIEDLKLRVLDRESQFLDDALQLTFKLQYRVTKQDTTGKMKDLTIKGGIVDG